MFKKLLVPLDQSTFAEQALGLAASIARAAHAAIDLALVLESAGKGASSHSDPAMDVAGRYLETMAKELTSGAGIKATHGVLRGDPAQMICARADDEHADLIVMTTHGRTGLSRAWLGSVAEGVVRRSPLPVLVVRSTDKAGPRTTPWPPINRVVVTVDGSELSSEILPSAIALAKASTASVVLLQIVQPVPVVVFDASLPGVAALNVMDDSATKRVVEDAEQNVAGLLGRLRKEGIANTESRVVVGPNVAQAITDFAHSHHADVIAMSTHGRGMSALFVGSVADKVRRASDIPVLLRRPASVEPK